MSRSLQVTSPTHLQAALNLSLLADLENRLRTRTVHSEIIWMLNPTSSVGALSCLVRLSMDGLHRS